MTRVHVAGCNCTTLKIPGNIGRPALSRICEACPNVQIDVILVDDTDTIVSLGSAAETWTANNKNAGYSENWFASVGAACPNLDSCSVSSSGTQRLSETSFNGLFFLPKPKLRDFDVCVTNKSCISTILQVLTVKVTSLENFSHKGPTTELDFVRLFVDSQKKLKAVQLHIRGPRSLCHLDAARTHETQTGPVWVPILSAFLKSSSLKEIERKCCNYYMDCNGYGGRVEEIADACCRVRTRHISIPVCGVQYM